MKDITLIFAIISLVVVSFGLGLLLGGNIGLGLLLGGYRGNIATKIILFGMLLGLTAITIEQL